MFENIINNTNLDNYDALGFYIVGSPKVTIANNTVNVNSAALIDPGTNEPIERLAGSHFGSNDELFIIDGNEFNSNIDIYNCGRSAVFDNFFDYEESLESKYEATHKNLLCNNTFEGKHNLIFKNNCTSTNLGTSNFNQSDGGFITEDGVISLQEHKGNKWISTSYAKVIGADNTFFVVNSDPNTGGDPAYLPLNILPNDDWFTDIEGQTETCSRTFSIFRFLNNDDHLIFVDSFEATSIVEWYQKLETFEKLIENPELLNNNDDAEDFYENHLETNIEYVVKAKKYLRESQYDSTLTALLECKFDLLDTLMNDLYVLLISFNEDPQEEIEDSVQTLMQDLLDLDTLLEELNEEYSEYRLNKLDTASFYNDLIEIENNFTQYEKTINAFAIERAADPEYELSYNDKQTVLGISSKCPETFGTSIFLARSFLSSEELIEIEQGDPCSEALIISSNNEVKPDNIVLLANPVENYLALDGLNLYLKYYLSIFDITGRNIYSGYYDNPIDVSFINSGMYIIKVENNNQVIEELKLIKL